LGREIYKDYGEENEEEEEDKEKYKEKKKEGITVNTTPAASLPAEKSSPVLVL